jgi:hypothetical protein
MVMKNRFVFYNLTALIEDYVYYADHDAELDIWLEEHNCDREGMVIRFCDEGTKMMFMLRWV